MAGQNYYLLTMLPSLVQLGGRPEMSPAELLGILEDSPRPLMLAKMLLLSDDLLQRDALLAGEIESFEPVTLTVAQCKGEEPLPDELQPIDTNRQPKVAGDALWDAYFRHAAEAAKELRSEFLAKWVGFEVALRNEMVEARARALDIEPTDYLVAEELGETDMNLAAVINEWTTAMAQNPLKGQRVLDQARWRWIETNDAYFSFGDDELAAYAAKLMLAVRWHRLAEALEEQSQD